MNDPITLIVAIVGVLGSAFSLYLSMRKAPKELKRMDIDTGSQALQSTERALKIANDAAEQVQEVRMELEALTTRYIAMQTELDETKEDVLRYQDWAERLVHQVQSLGAEPVKIKPKRLKEKQNVQ